MKKLSFVIGLAGVFALAAAAEAAIPMTRTLCISMQDPETNVTRCEYRKPVDKAMVFKNNEGEVVTLPGTKPVRSQPLEGQNPKMCDAFFEIQEKANGKCDKRLSWPREIKM